MNYILNTMIVMNFFMIKMLLMGLLFAHSFLCFAQKNGSSQEEKLEFYESHSQELKRVIKAFQDTCLSLYDCGIVKKLSIIPGFNYDSTGHAQISPELLILNDELKELKELGYVILKVDSVKILINHQFLKNSYFGDSICYLGEYPFKLSYESFENCIREYGIAMVMNIHRLNNGAIEIEAFGDFIPKRGKEK